MVASTGMVSAWRASCRRWRQPSLVPRAQNSSDSTISSSAAPPQ
jgi:hypothetical protein